MAITTARKLTGCRTGIDIGIIAVVTAFIPVFTFGEINADMTVTTTGSLAEGRASIGVIAITIITGFNTRLLHTITAGCARTIVETGIAFIGVTIVADLALRPLQKTIAAAC